MEGSGEGGLEHEEERRENTTQWFPLPKSQLWSREAQCRWKCMCFSCSQQSSGTSLGTTWGAILFVLLLFFHTSSGNLNYLSGRTPTP